MRTLLYARYSSQLQNARSIEDQLALLHARVAKEGWEVVGIHTDRAISGAAGTGEEQRPGLAALLACVEAGGIDQVLTESTDRIARHQGDAFSVRERLRFVGTRLFTLLDGEVDEITGTIKGLMDARMRSDLVARVRRGHRGVATQGRAPGGVAYGYRVANKLNERGGLVSGLREIDPDQAEIVRRIFHAYAAGQSALAIAAALNSEAVPPPKRGFWRASALLGQQILGTGILRNRIYVGEIVYGRTARVQSPHTRRYVVRPGEEPPTIGYRDDLRIIDDELWQSVQRQLIASAGVAPERQRRPKHVLSGLAFCKVCGSNWIITGNNGAAGMRVWGCARSTERACSNRRKITSHVFERRVLDGLKAQLLAPDVVSAYVQEYHLEHTRRIQTLGRDRARVERRLEEAGRKVERLVSAIADGGSSFAEIRSALAVARDEQEKLRRDLAGMDALPILTLHPGLAADYRRQITALGETLNDPAARLEAVPRVRALIQRIDVWPAEGKSRGVDLHVVRHVDEMLNLAMHARQECG